MKQTSFVLFTLFMLFALNSQAQSTYKAAVGARVGTPLSASIKYFATEKLALEAYVGTRGNSGYRWTNVSAAAQIHKSLDLSDELAGLTYYVGAGTSVYFWNYDDLFGFSGLNSTSIGIQGYGGFDYAFNDLPLNLSVDWTPTFFLGNGFLSGFGAGYGTLGVRYILGR